MFDNLQDQLQEVFDDLRGKGPMQRAQAFYNSLHRALHAG